MSDNKQIISYVWYKGECFFVSTITRESSASLGPKHYNETVVWPYDWDKRERAPSFIFQDGETKGSISLHIQVVKRIFETGNPDKPEN